MTEWREKRRPTSEPSRQRSADAAIETPSSGGRPADAVASLQRAAGNAAVTALLANGAGGAGAQTVQRAPAKPDLNDEKNALMRPESDKTGPAGAAKSKPDAGSKASGGGFEQDLFETAVMNPMRAVFANVRDTPPNAEKALELLMPIGQALWDYENRFRGQDDALAQGFFAARGWLGQTVKELQRRVGPVHTLTDQEIADRIQDTIVDLGGLQGKLR